MSSSVFLSYRRDDVPDTVDRIFETLENALGCGTCFMDVDTSALGVDFRECILDALSDCKVCLVIIGPGWIDARGEDGSRRLDNPSDWVRIEVATALSAGIHVIPVLTRNTPPPRPDQVPREIEQMCYRGAATVRRNPDFQHDMGRLVEEIRGFLANPGQRTTLRAQFESLKRSHAELAAQARDFELEKLAAQREVNLREDEIRQIAKRAAEETHRLRLELAATKRQSAQDEIERQKLAQKDLEASRLEALANAEAATRAESETRAIAELENERQQAHRRQQYESLASLLRHVRESQRPAEQANTGSIDIQTEPSDYQAEDVFDRVEQFEADARRIAHEPLTRARVERLRRTTEHDQFHSNPRYRAEPVVKSASDRNARRAASHLSTLAAPFDMGLAIHYEIQIERQQGIRIPVRISDIPQPALGHYAESLPERPRVEDWFGGVGDVVAQGYPLVSVKVGERVTTLVAPDNVMIVSQLVEKEGYVPTSGIIGYLQQI